MTSVYTAWVLNNIKSYLNSTRIFNILGTFQVHQKLRHSNFLLDTFYGQCNHTYGTCTCGAYRKSEIVSFQEF